MLRKQFNAVVSYLLAIGGEEIQAATEDLPSTVRNGLERALQLEGQVLRYDLDTKRAFCLEKKGPALNMWQWNDVRSYDEAAALLEILVITDDQPLNLESANRIYALSTGRDPSHPC